MLKICQNVVLIEKKMKVVVTNFLKLLSLVLFANFLQIFTQFNCFTFSSYPLQGIRI